MNCNQMCKSFPAECNRAGFQYELVRDRLVRTNPPNQEHDHITVLLATALQNFVRPLSLGRVLVEPGYTLTLNPDSVRGPDVSFVRSGRSDYPPRRGFYVGAPDLAVEVRSPDDSIAGLLEKANEYHRAGTELVWIIDPEDHTARVLRHDGTDVTFRIGDSLDGEAVLPGFVLTLDEVFDSPSLQRGSSDDRA